MTDPTRWRTDTTRRPAEAGVILRGARRPRVPGNGELARLDVAVADIPCLAAARRMIDNEILDYTRERAPGVAFADIKDVKDKAA